MENQKTPVIIALVGKGGVGKTSLSALMVRMLSRTYPDKKILAIDADPAVGLATALGISVCSTVDDIRKTFIENAEKGEGAAPVELLAEASYQLVDALVDEKNISFLAIGRPEAAGCYCSVNGYLRDVISRIANQFDYVVIDGEAGIEQVNRRVMETVTHLVMVSDASQKGIQVVQTIRKVAEELVRYEKCGLVLNRIPDPSLQEQLEMGDISILACIGDDRAQTMSDMMGKTVFSIPEDAPVYRGCLQALENLEIIEKR